MSRRKPARVPSGPRDTVIPPDNLRFVVQKIDRLHLTRMKEGHQEVAHRADILDLEDEPIHGSLSNVQTVDGRAGKIVGLFEVE